MERKISNSWTSRKRVYVLASVILVCFIWSLILYNKLTLPNIFYDITKPIYSLSATSPNAIPDNTTVSFEPHFPFRFGALDKPVVLKTLTSHQFTVTYETCIHIPKPPAGTNWAEELFIDDPPLTNLINTVSPAKCAVRLIGPARVNLGDTIHVRIELFDGNGKKRTGRDLVRAWMREQRLGAASVAKVTDNLDGTYDAEFIAFWVGRPEIRVAIINPREVIAVQFRRRYTCPPVFMNTGDFGDPGGRTENTPCSYYPQIPGFIEVCNLTQANYGRPWYCGKPRSQGLSCTNWSMASERRLYEEGFEKQLHSPLENQLLSRQFQAMMIPSNITVHIQSADGRTRTSTPDLKCNSPDRRHSWLPAPPTGYLYNKQWTARTCTGRDRNQQLASCLKNTKMVLIGDSTVREMFASLTKMVSCKEGTPTFTQENKHTWFVCDVPVHNFNIEFRLHELPFCTMKNKLRFLVPLNATLSQFHRSDHGTHSNIVILFHVFAHFLNYHSHVFYEGLKAMKAAIIDLLDANPNARVIFKGPHAFAFELHVPSKFFHMPERYMEVYANMIKKEFEDVQDRVIYLDTADITTATEQKFIHPDMDVVRELNYQIFDFICPY